VRAGVVERGPGILEVREGDGPGPDRYGGHAPVGKGVPIKDANEAVVGMGHGITSQGVECQGRTSFPH
jgi:hypothetical protein